MTDSADSAVISYLHCYGRQSHQCPQALMTLHPARGSYVDQRFPGKADVCSQISLSTDHRRSGYVDERLIAVADFSN